MHLFIPNESPLVPHRDWVKRGGSLLVRDDQSIIRLPKPIAGGAGFNPDEGETNQAQVLFQRIHVDRNADLQLGLFTDAAPGETITEATINEPTGGGYARITLTDASWNVSGDTADFAEQTFNVIGTDYSANVYGYFLSTQGTTDRLWIVEVDPSGPYDLNVGDSYSITPNITIANA